MDRVYEVTTIAPSADDEQATGTTVAFMSIRDGLAIVNDAMMGGRSKVRTISSGHGRHSIEYKDGRRVRLIEVNDPRQAVAAADEQAADEPRTAVIYRSAGGDTTGRVVTVKGKDYVLADGVRDGKHYDRAAGEWLPTQYVTYWSVRNGERFGSTRTAGSYSKRGTTGRAIWDAASK